jgi:transcriptional regulator with XRE-family HTH domain
MPVGTELRQARERAGLSAEQIAERTKIQLYKIEALENDNFEHLPAGIYLDGIVRAYAHEVAINADPLIGRLRDERAIVAQDRQAAAADLDAFPFEGKVSSDEAAPAARNIDVPYGARLSEPPDQSEPVRPARGPSRFVLPLLLLLFATAVLVAYLYPATGRFDRDAARDTATASTRPPTADRGSSSQQPKSGDSTTVDVATATIMPDDKSSAPYAEPPPLAATASGAPDSAGTAGSAKDVSGAWTLATHVESSSYSRFEGLRLSYELQLEQVANRVKGAGRKVTENGDDIGSRAETPIVVAGVIDGDRLTLTFNERGARRPTQGKFVLLLDEDGTLRGRFSSTAAQSSGTVEAHRASR